MASNPSTNAPKNTAKITASTNTQSAASPSAPTPAQVNVDASATKTDSTTTKSAKDTKKTGATNKSASQSTTATANSKLASKSKPKPTLKNRLTGCLLKLILLIAIIAGGSYYIWQQPALRSFLQPVVETIVGAIKSTSQTESVTATTNQTQTDAAPEHALTRAESSEQESPSESHTLDSLSKNESPTMSDSPLTQSSNRAEDISQLQLQIDEMSGMLSDLQNENYELQTQLEQLRTTPESQDTILIWTTLDKIKLELINFQLQQNGDTDAAAVALAALARSGRINSQWLENETARLQNATSFDGVIFVLDRIDNILHKRRDNARKRAAEHAMTFWQNHSGGFFANLGERIAIKIVEWFNIRRTVAAAEEKEIENDLLELQNLRELFVGKKREQYLQALSDFADRPHDTDNNMQVQIDLLQKFGAPYYALTSGAFQ